MGASLWNTGPETTMTAATPHTGDISWAVTEEKVWTALQRLIAAADPVKIVAFGSRAKGAAREDSDLDLAVILGRILPSRLFRCGGLFQAFGCPST